jgi:hypothetical protein
MCQVLMEWGYTPGFASTAIQRLTIIYCMSGEGGGVFNPNALLIRSADHSGTVSARSNAGIMGSNSTQGMDVNVRLFYV